MAKFPILFFFLLLLSIASQSLSATFTITNKCRYTIWPGVLSGAGTPPLASTGFMLGPSETRTLDATPSWSGRIWARSLCSSDPTGRFTCTTGDCGSGTVECSGGGATPPATLAEFTLNGSGGLDFYDVSLVDGYNLPVSVVPQGGSGGACGSTGCLVDLNEACPADLKVVLSGNGETVACKSACEAFGSPQYCCSGAFGSPSTCAPSTYSQFFKNACPRAYSYAYDDASSTFTCASASYIITFCPSITSQKSSGGGNHEGSSSSGTLPLINYTMVFLGSGEELMSHAKAHAYPTLSSLFVATLVVSCRLLMLF